jgi:hypothetical protein
MQNPVRIVPTPKLPSHFTRSAINSSKATEFAFKVLNIIDSFMHFHSLSLA